MGLSTNQAIGDTSSTPLEDYIICLYLAAHI